MEPKKMLDVLTVLNKYSKENDDVLWELLDIGIQSIEVEGGTEVELNLYYPHFYIDRTIIPVEEIEDKWKFID